MAHRNDPDDACTSRPWESSHSGLRRLSLWGPVVAYMALIFAGSSMTRLPEMPSSVNDKMAHTLEYAGLGLLTVRALAGGSWKGVRSSAVIATVLIAVTYGTSDEVHQLFVPGRQFDVRDIAADAAGAAAAAVVLWTWGIIRRLSDPHSGCA